MALQPLNLQSIQQRSGGIANPEPAALTRNPQYTGGNPFNNISQDDLRRILLTLIMSILGRGGDTNRPPINPPINPPIADGWHGPNPPIADGPRPPVCPPPPIADGPRPPNPPPINPPIADGIIADGPRPPNPPPIGSNPPPIADGWTGPNPPPIADGIPIADGPRPPNPPPVGPNPPPIGPNPPPIADGVRPNPPIADGVRPNPPIADGHIRPPNPPIGKPDNYDVSYGRGTMTLSNNNVSLTYSFSDLQALFEQFKALDQYPEIETMDLRTTPWGYSGSSSALDAFYNYLLDGANKG